MSYINDALRKAQEDKKSPYAAYEPILSASGKKITGPRKWLPTAGILIFLVCTAGIIALLNRPEEKKISVNAHLAAANVQIVAPLAQPQVVEEITVENKNEPVSKTKKIVKRIKVKKEITDSKKLYAQALQKQQEGSLKEAKSLYKKVIKIDPRNVEALNNLGVVYMKKKVNKWAIIRLNDALKVKYDYPDAHYNLACIYAQNNDLSRSISYLKNAIGFNPEVRKWAQNDNDLKVLADLPEFKKLLENK
jgi:tetratricopeptide (TPR) repeat protein